MRDDNNPAKYNDILSLQEIAYFAELVFSNLMVRFVKILFYNQSSYVIANPIAIWYSGEYAFDTADLSVFTEI